MDSRSRVNFANLASADLQDIPQIPSPRALPRVMTVPGVISDVDGCGFSDADTDNCTSSCRERKIVVANMLPLHAQKNAVTDRWCFSLDEDSLLLQLKDGFSPETEVIYVGSLKVEIDASEQEEVSQKLLDNFNCVPTFLPHDLQKKFYHGFCKQQLWPLFHYMLPMSPEHGDRFDRVLWQAYVSANKIFADKVMEVVNPDDDYIWVHDYHLMVLPTFLRKHCNRVKLGFFLHSPFPSSEIYRTLPVRNEILRGLLNCDLIGFHTFDYARHFLSCCRRMLGLDYESKRGHIGLDYSGRTVYIKILPVGVHMGRLESVLNLPSTSVKVKEIQEQFKGKRVILGVDDMDIFKGISLKLLAFEQLLQQHQDLQGKLVLVQIVNPARSSGKDVQEVKRETYLTASRINEVYGSPDYEPVILIDRHVARYEKSAYYAVAECCIVSAVRDGMNLVPYKYIICRHGYPHMDEARGIKLDSPRTSMLVVSEFIGCSPSLSGAIRVNPWDIDSVAEAMNSAITMPDSERQMRHEKHYRYVSSHDVAYWARSFVQDLERACKDHYSKRYWGIGFGLGFRVVSLSPSFRKLSIDYIGGERFSFNFRQNPNNSKIRKMQEKKGDMSTNNSTSSTSKNPKKANLLDHHSIKNILDESASEIVTGRGYTEDVRMSNIRLLIGTIIIVIALLAQFYNKKFPDNKNFLIGCIALYVLFNVILQLIIYTKEKNAILFTYPPVGSFNSTGLVVSSKLPRFSDMYTLNIASADPQSISAKPSVEFTKSVTQWFTKEGVLVEGLFWKDVEGLINDYAKEPKKSK